MGKLPETLDRLQKLETLGLCDQELGSLPEALQRMPNLKVLDLSGSRLDQAPAWLGELALEQFGVPSKESKAAAQLGKVCDRMKQRGVTFI